MTATDTGSDIGRHTIKTRKVTSWQPSWSASGNGEPGTYILQLILDDGASEVVLALTEPDADNLFDWLTASKEVYYDLEREVIIFGTRRTGG